MPRSALPLAALLALAAGPLSAADVPPAEALPAGAKVVRLDARPAKIDLRSPFAYAQLLVTATLDGGDTADVTRIATVTVPKAVKVSPAGLVRPAADGVGEVTVSVGGQSLAIPVTVAGAAAVEPVSFVKDVQPTLSKLGCNAGTCHGAQAGKNGFKLSLRGYDPLYDFRALTDDLEGRRFNPAAPERSLMLLKTSGAVPHQGGVLTGPGEPAYELLRRWIGGGVRLDLETPRVKSVEVFPKDPTVARLGMKQQFAVVATYTDGTTRDVTAESFVDSSNTDVATVDKAGLLTAVRRGEATMLARYEGSYAASTVVVMGDRTGFAWNDPPEFNWVDELVDKKLKRVKVLPSEVCDDSEFVRRVHIDLTGLPPTPEAVRAFLADARPAREKRGELVDKLVGSDAFVEHWTNKWADLLQVNRKFLGDAGAAALRKWTRDAVAANMPYDKMAYEVLTASGSNVAHPPAAYYKTLRDAPAVMENTTQLFLAVRFNCNKCHDHPFERWTQDQYYQMAAFFARVDRTEDPKFKGQKLGGTAVEKPLPLAEVIADAKAGEIKHERTGEVAAPKFPYEVAVDVPADASRRVRAAKWITSPKNQYFAKSHVNRVWSYLLGVGLIEPVDDIRAGNPPSNPELLDRLTNEFVASGFDTQKLIKLVCKSRTYQMSISTNKWNKDDDLNYSHALPRRLSAEVLYDAVHAVTGSQSKLPGLPKGARAAQLVDSNVELPGGFLELFGKPVRESACECERSNGMNLGPVLAMVNGPIVAEAIRDPQNRIAKIVAGTADDAKAVEEIYLAVLNRVPTKAETERGVEALAAAGADRTAMVAAFERKKAEFAAYQATLDGRQKTWEDGLRSLKPTAWTTLDLDPKSLKAKSEATLTPQKDGSVLVGGKSAATEVYTVAGVTKLKGITAVRLEVLADDHLPAKGPGRAANGNFVLNEFGAKFKRLSIARDEDNPVKFKKAEATFSQTGFPAANAVDTNLATGWAVQGGAGKDQAAVFVAANAVGKDDAGVRFTFTLEQRYGGDHAIGRFRLSVTADANPKAASSPLPPDQAALLATPADKRTPEQAAKLRAMYLAQDAEYTRLNQEAADAPPSDARVLGAQDLVWALMNSPAFLFNH